MSGSRNSSIDNIDTNDRYIPSEGTSREATSAYATEYQDAHGKPLKASELKEPTQSTQKPKLHKQPREKVLHGTFLGVPLNNSSDDELGSEPEAGRQPHRDSDSDDLAEAKNTSRLPEPSVPPTAAMTKQETLNGHIKRGLAAYNLLIAGLPAEELWKYSTLKQGFNDYSYYAKQQPHSIDSYIGFAERSANYAEKLLREKKPLATHAPSAPVIAVEEKNSHTNITQTSEPQSLYRPAKLATRQVFDADGYPLLDEDDYPASNLAAVAAPSTPLMPIEEKNRDYNKMNLEELRARETSIGTQLAGINPSDEDLTNENSPFMKLTCELDEVSTLIRKHVREAAEAAELADALAKAQKMGTYDANAVREAENEAMLREAMRLSEEEHRIAIQLAEEKHKEEYKEVIEARFKFIRTQLATLKADCELLFKTDDYNNLIGVFGSVPTADLNKAHLASLQKLIETRAQALRDMDPAGSSKMSPNDNDPLPLFVNQQKEKLKAKLVTSIATRRKTAEQHLVTLHGSDAGSVYPRMSRLGIFNGLAAKIENRAGLKTLDDFNQQLAEEIKNTKKNATETRETNQRVGRQMIEQLKSKGVNVTQVAADFETAIRTDKANKIATMTSTYVGVTLPELFLKTELYEPATELFNNFFRKRGYQSPFDERSFLESDLLQQEISDIQSYIERLKILIEIQEFLNEIYVENFSPQTQQSCSTLNTFISTDNARELLNSVKVELQTARENKAQKEWEHKQRQMVINLFHAEITASERQLEKQIPFLTKNKDAEGFPSEYKALTEDYAKRYKALEDKDFDEVPTKKFRTEMTRHNLALKQLAAETETTYKKVVAALEAKKVEQERLAAEKLESETQAAIKQAIEDARGLIAEREKIISEEFKKSNPANCTLALNEIIDRANIKPVFRLQELQTFCRRMASDNENIRQENARAEQAKAAEKAREEASAAEAAKKAADAEAHNAQLVRQLELAVHTAQALITKMDESVQSALTEQLNGMKDHKTDSVEEKLIAVGAFSDNLLSINRLDRTEADQAAADAAIKIAADAAAEADISGKTFVSGIYHPKIHGDRNAFFAPFNKKYPLDGLDDQDLKEQQALATLRAEERGELIYRKNALKRGALGTDYKKETAEYVKTINAQKIARYGR